MSRHGEPEPFVKEEKKTLTDAEKLAAVKGKVDSGTRKKAIEGNDPIAKMKLNIAWAEQYPEHELAKAIKWLEKYWDLTKVPIAAEIAINKMKEIQKGIGIVDSWKQDGIIWRNTITNFEDKDKSKERADAQKLIGEFDQSLYTTDLENKTKEAENKWFSDVFKNAQKVWAKDGFFSWLKAWIRGATEVLNWTKVKDANDVEYTVKKDANWKNQYVDKNGEEFALNDGKLVSVTKQAKEKADYLKKLKWDMASTDRGDTENLRDVEGNHLQMDDTNWVRSLVWTGDKSGKIYNLDTGVYEETKTPQEIANKKKLIDTLKNPETMEALNGSSTLAGLKGQVALQGVELTKGTSGEIIGEKDGNKIYLTKNVAWDAWNISDKSPAEQKQQSYERDNTRLWELLENNLDWHSSNAGTSYRDLKIWEYESKKESFHGDGWDEGKPWKLPSGTDVYLGHVTTQAYIDKIYNGISRSDRTALSQADVTFGDYLKMKSDKNLAAEKLATGKPGQLPAGLWAEGVTYQKWDNNAIFTYNDKKQPATIIKNGKETNIVRYALESKDPTLYLPDGSKICRESNWGKQILQYFAKRGDEKSIATFRWWKWEKV